MWVGERKPTCVNVDIELLLVARAKGLGSREFSNFVNYCLEEFCLADTKPVLDPLHSLAKEIVAKKRVELESQQKLIKEEETKKSQVAEMQRQRLEKIRKAAITEFRKRPTYFRCLPTYDRFHDRIDEFEQLRMAIEERCGFSVVPMEIIEVHESLQSARS